MLKLVRSRPWVCTGCLRRASPPLFRNNSAGAIRSIRGISSTSRRSRQWQSTNVAGARPGPVDLGRRAPPGRACASTVAHASSAGDQPKGEAQDDSILRQVFDCPSTWHDFSSQSARFPAENAGLFRNAYLTSPDGFLAYAHSTLDRARRIVDRVLAASTLAEYRTVVRDLDRLSDLLCRVIDLCDFVRATHPDALFQKAASEAWFLMYQYMNQLNTTTGLNEQLGRAMADPRVAAAWSEEEAAVAHILKLDFTKSAVNLPQAARDRFVELSQRISEIGSDFVNGMAPDTRHVALPSDQLLGLDPTVARRFTRGKTVFLPTMSGEAAAALRSVHNDESRKAIFLAMRTASRRSVRLLEDLLRSRAALAELAGFESYAHMTLRDRMMAKSPESVEQFLSALAKNNSPRVQEEMARLLQEKERAVAQHNQQRQRQPPQSDGGDEAALVLNPWDRDYYMNHVRKTTRSRQKHDDVLSAYFSVGSVMQGLSRLFSRMFGIRFVPRETLPGEKWHPDVRRLDVVSDAEGHVAVLYCDLFYRADKSPNPAHFTVRCSREISEEELAEAAQQQQEPLPEDAGPLPRPSFESAEAAANDGMALSRQSGSLKQLPTIALVCDFPQRTSAGASRGGSSSPAASLTYQELETLFHEMGHAIHSVLARTSFQNVAGTRCATDLAELPSTLMEHFASDPAVLALFARHHETGEALDTALVAERLRQTSLFKGSDVENQVMLAMLDQALHSPAAVQRSFDSTEMYHALQRAHGSLPVDPATTRWQGFFGHLFGYGSAYYSYLFDQVLADRCWKVMFDSGRAGAALSRERGEHLKESLLRWGGSRDPWLCVSDALRDERIAGGGEEAMALVGSWGTSVGDRAIKSN